MATPKMPLTTRETLLMNEWCLPKMTLMDHKRNTPETIPFWTHVASILLLIIFFFFLLHFTHSYAYLLSMASMDHKRDITETITFSIHAASILLLIIIFFFLYLWTTKRQGYESALNSSTFRQCSIFSHLSSMVMLITMFSFSRLRTTKKQ